MTGCVAVTGGLGFIGRATVRALGAISVLIIDNGSTASSGPLGGAVEVAWLDVRDPSLPALLQHHRVEAIIHLAARAAVTPYGPEAVEAEGVNVGGTLAVLEGCRLAGVRRFVLASSAAVYGRWDRLPIGEDVPLVPTSAYGASKVAAEAYAHAYAAATGLEVVVCRPATVYGPGQTPRLEGAACSLFTAALVAGQPGTILGDGGQSRDLVFVDDVAEAFARAALTGHPGTYNLGTGKATSILDLYHQIARIAGVDVAPRFGPPRPGDIRHSVLDVERARRGLAWVARTELSEGLAATVGWMREGSGASDPSRRP